MNRKQGRVKEQAKVREGSVEAWSGQAGSITEVNSETDVGTQGTSVDQTALAMRNAAV